ncbi:hypothetical protein CBR_g39580 [Chara braunii]|uniref:Reverse transcriptase domain-containing protein n=1 Tax=Chara braunii TaxID=69332 RepID=A0A388K186_CHABU|nr:hypothetical protein CBR_g39580 [Chara braunii]|eukprot:GBG63799.1 hypothetical protein CBR_g39580 [Chara braunii]
MTPWGTGTSQQLIRPPGNSSSALLPYQWPQPEPDYNGSDRTLVPWGGPRPAGVRQDEWRTEKQSGGRRSVHGPDQAYVTVHINSEFDYENRRETVEAEGGLARGVERMEGVARENSAQIQVRERILIEDNAPAVPQPDQIMRDPGSKTSLLAPIKTRRVGEQGTSEPTREAEDGEGEVDFFNILSPPKPKPPSQSQAGGTRGGAKQTSHGMGHHYVVLFYTSLAPQGIKVLAGKTRAGEFALPAVHVDSFPGTKDQLRGAVDKFVVGRFPFRLISGIRVGRKSVDIGEEASVQVHLAFVDIKITQECANTLEGQGIHWLPPQWFNSDTSDEATRIHLVGSVKATLETKMDELKIDRFVKWWKDPQWWAPADGTRGGIAILFHRKLEVEVLESDFDIWGQWVWVRIRMGGQEWTLMSVYAPSVPAERRSFFRDLPNFTPVAANLVMAGDFNSVLQPGLDSPQEAPRRTDAVLLEQFMETQGLTDTFRHINPEDAGFTWISSQRNEDREPPRRRLDLVLTRGEAWEAVTCAEVDPQPLSDHYLVKVSFRLGLDLQKGKGFFRLSTENLKNKEMGFRIVTSALYVFSRILAKDRRDEELECRRMVKEAEAQIGKDPYSDIYWERRRDTWMRKWEAIHIKQQEVWARTIRALQHPFNAYADVAEDTVSLAEYATLYYQDILTSRRQPGESLQSMKDEVDLWQYTDKSLEVSQRLSLDRPLTLQELGEAVRSMAKGKSSGDDGLPAEFYEATWEQTGPLLLRLYNRVLEGHPLTEDMCRGVITLLYKKGDKTNIRNWRPISLLNVSYKILAKTLARRLAAILPGLVGADQGAFMKGRSISENIMVAIGALEVVGRERRQVAVAMLDLEKAYDRVNWSFVLATLEHMGFGSLFRRWVTALYGSSKATVLVNGERSQAFHLSKSLRQGCPLAPRLFVVQMEVLLNAIRVSPCIRGLQLHEGAEVVVGTIADYLLLVSEATPGSMGAAKALIDQYTSLSEAKVNWDKSVYFLPREYELPEDWSMKRISELDSERYLGVQVSLANSRPAQDSILSGKVEARVQRCKEAKGISLMGRATVITASVFSILWYAAAVVLISRATLAKIKTGAARYLWKPEAEDQGGFISKVAWGRVTQARNHGGLGIVDPEKQNLALIGKWIYKIATQVDQRSWLEIMLYILQYEFHLNRPGDVWVCLQVTSFLQRRPKSAIGLAWWIAWRKLRPPQTKPPEIREEVLIQPLFENEAIKQSDGAVFSASMHAGAFGRRWIEKGISQVRGLWEEDAMDWKEVSLIRRTLGRLRNVEDRVVQLRNAIPGGWVELL